MKYATQIGSVALVLLQGCASGSVPRSGDQGAARITVTVSGQVIRPGTFGLIEGATVKDALRAAGGLTDFASWGGGFTHSGITKTNGTFVEFHYSCRADDQQLILQDGDKVYISNVE